VLARFLAFRIRPVMLNWWNSLDVRGRFFFWAAFLLVVAGILSLTTGIIMGKLFAGAAICLVVGFFCPKDDSTKI
jgi:hypothetical protein